MKPAVPILRILLGLVIAVLTSSCSKPELLTDKYVTIKKTPLYQHVTVSGSYYDHLEKGDTIYAKDTFENCISLKVNGKKRYVLLKDLKKIDLAPEEVIVSETSPLPPLAQQFLYKYVNYWKWPFWVIGIGLFVLIFLLFSMGIGFEASFSADMNLSDPGIELFPILTFLAGLIVGVWYFFAPETTQRVIYFAEFMEIWPESNTAWLVLILSVLIVLLNIRLLIRNLWRYKGYGLYVYGIYTLFGIAALAFAMFLAIASIVVLILGTLIFFGLNVLSGLADTSGSYSPREKTQAERDRENREKDMARKRELARGHYINTGEHRDPELF